MVSSVSATGPVDELSLIFLIVLKVYGKSTSYCKAMKHYENLKINI